MPDEGLDYAGTGEEFMEDHMSWETMDNEAFVIELDYIRSQIFECIALVDKMVANSDCKKAEDGLMALAQGPISRSSWIYTYRNHNSDAFSKYLNGPSRPSWYGSLEPKKKQLYDTGLRYYKDALRLGEPFDAVAQLIIEIVSGETLRWNYRMLKIGDNMADKGIDANFYKTVELDARQVSDRINESRYDINNRIAEDSDRFYEENRGKMSESDFKRRYHQARLKDYIDDFRGRKLNDSFGALSDGSFYVSAEMLAKATVVDGYTNLIAQKENYTDTLDKYMDRINRILNETLAPGEKESETDAGRQLFVALRHLLTSISDNMSQTKDVMEAFKNGDANTSPYCFMRTLSAYDTIKPHYALKPQKVNPWDHGTEYKQLYIMEAVALTQHCESFVSEMGKAT